MSTLVVNIVRENGERLLPCASVGPRLAAASVSGRMFHGKAGNEGTCYRPNFSTYAKEWTLAATAWYE